MFFSVAKYSSASSVKLKHTQIIKDAISITVHCICNSASKGACTKKSCMYVYSSKGGMALDDYWNFNNQ